MAEGWNPDAGSGQDGALDTDTILRLEAEALKEALAFHGFNQLLDAMIADARGKRVRQKSSAPLWEFYDGFKSTLVQQKAKALFDEKAATAKERAALPAMPAEETSVPEDSAIEVDLSYGGPVGEQADDGRVTEDSAARSAHTRKKDKKPLSVVQRIKIRKNKKASRAHRAQVRAANKAKEKAKKDKRKAGAWTMRRRLHGAIEAFAIRNGFPTARTEQPSMSPPQSERAEKEERITDSASVRMKKLLAVMRLIAGDYDRKEKAERNDPSIPYKKTVMDDVSRAEAEAIEADMQRHAPRDWHRAYVLARERFNFASPRKVLTKEPRESDEAFAARKEKALEVRQNSFEAVQKVIADNFEYALADHMQSFFGPHVRAWLAPKFEDISKGFDVVVEFQDPEYKGKPLLNKAGMPVRVVIDATYGMFAAKLQSDFEKKRIGREAYQELRGTKKGVAKPGSYPFGTNIGMKWFRSLKELFRGTQSSIYYTPEGKLDTPIKNNPRVVIGLEWLNAFTFTDKWLENRERSHEEALDAFSTDPLRRTVVQNLYAQLQAQEELLASNSAVADVPSQGMYHQGTYPMALMNIRAALAAMRPVYDEVQATIPTARGDALAKLIRQMIQPKKLRWQFRAAEKQVEHENAEAKKRGAQREERAQAHAEKGRDEIGLEEQAFREALRQLKEANIDEEVEKARVDWEKYDQNGDIWWYYSGSIEYRDVQTAAGDAYQRLQDKEGASDRASDEEIVINDRFIDESTVASPESAASDGFVFSDEADTGEIETVPNFYRETMTLEDIVHAKSLLMEAIEGLETANGSRSYLLAQATELLTKAQQLRERFDTLNV